MKRGASRIKTHTLTLRHNGSRNLLSDKLAWVCFVTANYLLCYVYRVVRWDNVWVFLWLHFPALGLSHFCQNFFFLAHTIQSRCFAFLLKRNVFIRAASSSALWTTTPLFHFSRHTWINVMLYKYIPAGTNRMRRCDVNAISAANVTQLAIWEECACGWKSSYQAVE